MEDLDRNGDSENRKAMEFLMQNVARLSEHFDSVRIIATRTEGGDTSTFTVGSGNYFAQLGSVREWVIKQDERSRIEQREDQDGD